MNTIRHYYIFIVHEKGVLYGDDSSIDVLRDLCTSDGYKNVKEMLSYYILAYNIYINHVSIVIVTDRNTISGIEKAINKMSSKFPNAVYLEVIPGIEISCAGKIHLVTIASYDVLNEYFYEKLSGSLLSEKEGTYKTSLDLINELNKTGIFNYIAHINSSNIYTESRFLSGGYKNKLLSSENLKYIGVSNKDKIDKISSFLSNCNKEEKYFLLDNNAHFIERVELTHLNTKLMSIMKY
nr:hypothetical protein [Mammaliicoccus lentus]